MSIDKLLVSIFGVFGIGCIYWYFLGKQDEAIEASDTVEILVDGGYTPDAISVSKGKPIKIIFIRKDTNSCLEEVVLSDFKIRRALPLNTKVTVEINPEKTGIYPFSCGMGMYHGKIIVRG